MGVENASATISEKANGGRKGGREGCRYGAREGTVSHFNGALWEYFFEHGFRFEIWFDLI